MRSFNPIKHRNRTLHRRKRPSDSQKSTLVCRLPPRSFSSIFLCALCVHLCDAPILRSPCPPVPSGFPSITPVRYPVVFSRRTRVGAGTIGLQLCGTTCRVISAWYRPALLRLACLVETPWLQSSFIFRSTSRTGFVGIRCLTPIRSTSMVKRTRSFVAKWRTSAIGQPPRCCST